jgi:HSP20 family molecular chaperone IbpA
MSETTPAGKRENTHGGPFLTPRVDIFETDAELILLAEMPSVKAEDVELHFDRGELVLHARVRPRERSGPALTEEFALTDFYRVFQIHESVDGAAIDANCKNGVLTVKLPKTDAKQPKHVAVRGE